MKRVYVGVVKALTSAIPFAGMVSWAGDTRWRVWAVSLLAIHDFDRMRLLGWPWWTFTAAQHVSRHLEKTPGPRVFEWGSGASTLWLADRATEVHVVEHDPAWGELVRATAPSNVQVTTVPPVQATEGGTSVRSQKPGFAGLDFSAYCDAINDVPGLFDVIVVDGRAREACLVAAVDRLAPDGLIVFDNVDRRRYVEAMAALGSRISVHMTRGLTPALPYPTRTALITVESTP